MTDEEVMAAAMSDPDARPLTDEQRRTALRVPCAKTLRRALALPQEEFALRRVFPTVIAHDSEGVQRTLAKSGRPCPVN